MKVYAQALDLKNDEKSIAEYEEYHRNVWPEVLEALETMGVIRMRIFRVNERLFMFMETEDNFDPSRFSKYTEQNSKAKEWDNLMKGYQKQIPDPKGDWWSAMTLAFDSEWSNPMKY